MTIKTIVFDKSRIALAAALTCLLAFMHGASAQSGFAPTLTLPEHIARNQIVAPGQSGEFAFSIVNSGTMAGGVSVFARSDSPAETLAGYTFVALDPVRCQVPIVGVYVVGVETLRFSVGPVEPAETLTCSYTVTRAPTAVNDLAVGMCPSLQFAGNFFGCNEMYLFGGLPDLALSVEQVAPVAPGATEALVRLRLNNLSGHDVASRIASTDCREFHGGFFDDAPFDVETGFPGSCPLDTGEICLNFTGQNFDSYGFRLGPVPAGGSATCLVKLRLHEPASGPVSTSLYLLDDRVTLPNGGTAFDPNRSNELANLGILGVANQIPLSSSGLLLLALTLAVAGVVGMRRRILVS